MELYAGLSVAILVLSALLVAIKTLTLWRRTRGLPELLLGLMLLSATVIGYPLAVACARIPATEFLPIHVAYPMAISVGFACMLLFTQKVFRPSASWAKGFAAIMILALAGCAVAYIMEATSAQPRSPLEMRGLSIVNSALIAFAYFWTTSESLAYYRRSRLQLRLGLTSAVVVNRFLLWGLMGGAAGLAVVLNFYGIVTGEFMNPVMVTLSSTFGLVLASCLFLAFHPPVWYRAWVESRSAAAAA
jgi:hypothetical protein